METESSLPFSKKKIQNGPLSINWMVSIYCFIIIIIIIIIIKNTVSYFFLYFADRASEYIYFLISTNLMH